MNSLRWGSWAVIQKAADSPILSFPPSWLHNPAYVGVLYFPVQTYIAYHTREVMGQTRCNTRGIRGQTRTVQAHTEKQALYMHIVDPDRSLGDKVKIIRIPYLPLLHRKQYNVPATAIAGESAERIQEAHLADRNNTIVYLDFLKWLRMFSSNWYLWHSICCLFCWNPNFIWKETPWLRVNQG